MIQLPCPHINSPPLSPSLSRFLSLCVSLPPSLPLTYPSLSLSPSHLNDIRTTIYLDPFIVPPRISQLPRNSPSPSPACCPTLHLDILFHFHNGSTGSTECYCVDCWYQSLCITWYPGHNTHYLCDLGQVISLLWAVASAYETDIITVPNTCSILTIDYALGIVLGIESTI